MESLIIQACIYNKIDIINYAIKENIIFYENIFETALKTSFMNGNIEIVKLLLEKNDINHIQGDNLIRFACYSGNLELVKYLVEKRYTLKYKQELNLQFAIYSRNLEIVNIVKNNCETFDKQLLIKYACDTYDKNVIKYIINNFDITFNDYMTVLHKIYVSIDLEIFKLLESLGFNSNKYFSDICLSGDIETIEYFLSIYEIGTKYMTESLYKACCKGVSTTIDYLVNRGISLSNEMYCGICYSGNLELIKKYFNKKYHSDKNFMLICLKNTAASNKLEALEYFYNLINFEIPDDIFIDVLDINKSIINFISESQKLLSENVLMDQIINNPYYVCDKCGQDKKIVYSNKINCDCNYDITLNIINKNFTIDGLSMLEYPSLSIQRIGIIESSNYKNLYKYLVIKECPIYFMLKYKVLPQELLRMLSEIMGRL